MTLSGVPETDTEVIELFQNSNHYNDQTQISLIGIYNCRRALGDDCPTAYIFTLQCLVNSQPP